MCGFDLPTPSTYKTPRCLQPVEKSAATDGDLVVEEFPITYDGYTYPYGRIAYVKGRPPAPVVLVHHNYAGLKQFDVDQACWLARVGYVGLAVDLYKATDSFTYEDRNLNAGRLVDFDGFCVAARAENIVEKPPPAEMPTEELRVFFDAFPKAEEGKLHWQGVRHFIGAFMQMQRLLTEPARWRGVLAANVDAAFRHPAVKPGLAGALGYCLGGQSCLEHLRAGHNVQAVCSLHGLLHSRPMDPKNPFESQKRIGKDAYDRDFGLPNTYTPGCRVLIENGEKDGEVPMADILAFGEEMNEHKVDWRFENHARGPHGFALAKGIPGGDHYDEVIDRRSSIAMLSLFAEAWPDYEQHEVECNASGCKLGQMIVPARFSKKGVSSAPNATMLSLLAIAAGAVVAIAARRASR